jgi:hypothetical protein
VVSDDVLDLKYMSHNHQQFCTICYQVQESHVLLANGLVLDFNLGVEVVKFFLSFSFQFNNIIYLIYNHMLNSIKLNLKHDSLDV